MALPDDEAKKAEPEVPHSDLVEAPEEPEAAPAGAEPEDGAELSTDEALARALEEVARYKDLALRAEAEVQNMQRRTARDIENAHKFGIERFLQNLFPVVDSLEKAIESAEQASEAQGGDGAGEAIIEGVRLCYKLLTDVLERENVEILDPVGEPFDPQEHQAMSMVDNPEMEPNSVFAVVQKGYKLNGRLVRAAMVMVTRAPAETPETPAGEG